MANGKCVLVVEDDEDAAEITRVILESFGHACAVAHCGRDAIRISRELRPDVALLDVALPDLSGFEVARALRGGPGGASMYLVAVTGYADAVHRQRAIAAGFDRYFVKPVTIATIAQAIPDDEAADPRSRPSSLRRELGYGVG